MRVEKHDIVVIGAGPSGALAAALLRQQGRQVVVLEKEVFPRFSIGESLLPQCMEFLQQAGLLQDVVEAGFQYKNGAAFSCGDKYTYFDFRDKFSEGWGTTYQVQRADFDKVVADASAKTGAEFRYQQTVLDVKVDGDCAQLQVKDSQGEEYQIQAAKILDASGFARILPRLLDLETPSDFPVRGAIFTHVEDNFEAGAFDRQKILISVHPQQPDVWYWTIPFSNGRCSLGVVGERSFLDGLEGSDEMSKLKAAVAQAPTLQGLLKNAVWDTPARSIVGYSANVKTLWGKHFALLGNAGEFLDPVFSSGVTIAFKSAMLAAECIQREAQGETVDWQNDYELALRQGVDVFRVFVNSWYRGGFQAVIFHDDHNADVRRMISAILAGYAWDAQNPYVDKPERMKTLEALCGFEEA